MSAPVFVLRNESEVLLRERQDLLQVLVEGHAELTLTEMLQQLKFGFQEIDDERMFEEYVNSAHCQIYSHQNEQESLMARSGGRVFFFSPVYCLDTYGWHWAYQSEIESLLRLYQNRLFEYDFYAEECSKLSAPGPLTGPDTAEPPVAEYDVHAQECNKLSAPDVLTGPDTAEPPGAQEQCL